MWRLIIFFFVSLGSSSFLLSDTTEYANSLEPQYAEVHVFRPKQFQGGAITFQIQVNDKTVARLANGSRITYRIYNEGTVDFKLKASVFKSKGVSFGIVKGQHYYIQASYGDGFGSKLSFVPFTEAAGMRMFNNVRDFHSNKIKQYEEDKLNPVVRDVDIFSENLKKFEESDESVALVEDVTVPKDIDKPKDEIKPIKLVGPKPRLGWLNPESSNLRTDIGTLSLQLCLKSNAEKMSLKVKLNGADIDKLDDIVVVDKKCSYTYINNLVLSEGKNHILIEVEDIYGKSTFGKIVILQKRKKEYRGLALVIGNADYLIATDLKNPKNDSRDMAKAMETLGFEVLKYDNLSNIEMKKAIGHYMLKLESYKTGIVFYAGHGIQHNGKNFLIPVDVGLDSGNEIEKKCIDTGSLLSKMELMQLETSILILDACRSNPFKGVGSGVVDSSTGLTGTDAPAGSIVAYATAPGKTASDGNGTNGLYTQEILKNIYKEDLKVEEMFKRVRVGVMNESYKKQIPWETSSLVDDFYFNQSQN